MPGAATGRPGIGPLALPLLDSPHNVQHLFVWMPKRSADILRCVRSEGDKGDEQAPRNAAKHEGAMVIWIPSDASEWDSSKARYPDGAKLDVPGYPPIDLNDGAKF